MNKLSADREPCAAHKFPRCRRCFKAKRLAREPRSLPSEVLDGVVISESSLAEIDPQGGHPVEVVTPSSSETTPYE